MRIAAIAVLAVVYVGSSQDLKVDNRGAPGPFLFKDNGRTVVTFSDADIPVGPCNLGDLVRAMNKHMALQHVTEPSLAWTSCSLSPSGFCVPTPGATDEKPPEDFNSWEVCGDETYGHDPLSRYVTPAASSIGIFASGIRTPAELRKMADCIERRDAKVARMEKWKDEQRKKISSAEVDLKLQLSECSSKK